MNATVGLSLRRDPIEDVEIRRAVDALGLHFDLLDVQAACPDLCRRLLCVRLGELVRDGIVDRTGKGTFRRSATYIPAYDAAAAAPVGEVERRWRKFRAEMIPPPATPEEMGEGA